MTMHISRLALICIAGVVSFLTGQAASLEAQSRTPVQIGNDVRPDTVTVGQHFTATFRIRAPQGATVRFPEKMGTPANVDTAGAMQRIDTTMAGYTEVTVRYRLAAWRTGFQQLGLEDAVVSLNGRDITISLTDSVFVASVLPADTALRKPKDPRATFTLRVFNWMPWAIAAAIIALLGFLWWLWRWFRRRHEKPFDPFSWAEREFQRVASLRLMEQDQPEQHAILMTGVVRGYLEREFVTVPSSSTTRELVSPLQAVPVVPFERTLSLFEKTDLLKFANTRITNDEAQSVGNESQAVVRQINDQVQASRSKEAA